MQAPTVVQIGKDLQTSQSQLKSEVFSSFGKSCRRVISLQDQNIISQIDQFIDLRSCSFDKTQPTKLVQIAELMNLETVSMKSKEDYEASSLKTKYDPEVEVEYQ